MRNFSLIALILSVSFTSRFAEAKHYVILKNGSEVECAVLRQDTAVVVVTTWDSRELSQPDLQVYSIDEVESVWFEKPQQSGSRRHIFVPHSSGMEVGGGFAFQQWAEGGALITDETVTIETVRRQLVLLSLHGGYSAAKQIGLELDASFTFPLGGGQDSVWKSYDAGYQATMNIIAHPWIVGGFVPFALVGGGASVGVPVGNALLTSSKDLRNLVVFGIGAKWGWNGFGFRSELRHHFYTWTPDIVNSAGIRVSEHTADATVLRVSMFLYK